MPTTPSRYAWFGYRSINGWIRPGALHTALALDNVQRRLGITGDVGEIGVHHGQFYALLHLLRREAEQGVAIDVFEDQHLNVDKSGEGDRVIFETNIRRVSGTLDGLTIIQDDSRNLTPEALKAFGAGTGFRIFSVDGGHTADLAQHDTDVAAEALVNGGVVIVDDYYNSWWPGVVEGIARYFLSSTPPVVPFAIGHSKLLLTHAEVAPAYREELKRLAQRRLWHNEEQYLFGAPVVVAEKFSAKRRSKLFAKNVLLKTPMKAMLPSYRAAVSERGV